MVRHFFFLPKLLVKVRLILQVSDLYMYAVLWSVCRA